MKTLKEFSEQMVNRSNNNGKLNYEVLSIELGQNFHERKEFSRLGSKSDEKKLLRRWYQKFLLDAATNINSYSKQEKKELYELIVKVQGSFSSAKQLYNAKNYEKETLAKQLFSGLKEFALGVKFSTDKTTATVKPSTNAKTEKK